MPDEQTSRKRMNIKCNASGGGLYGAGAVGAAIYFIQHADSFGAGVVGLLKAIIWPAFLVYHLFTFLQL